RAAQSRGPFVGAPGAQNRLRRTSAMQRFLIDGQLRDLDELRRLVKGARTLPRQRYALAALLKSRPRQLLDAGCYVGAFLEAVRAAIPQVEAYGVDNFPDNIAAARALFPNQAERVICATIYDLPFPDGHFDCVTFLEVVEHLDRPVDAIRELNRVLRDGGQLI